MARLKSNNIKWVIGLTALTSILVYGFYLYSKDSNYLEPPLTVEKTTAKPDVLQTTESQLQLATQNHQTAVEVTVAPIENIDELSFDLSRLEISDEGNRQTHSEDCVDRASHEQQLLEYDNFIGSDYDDQGNKVAEIEYLDALEVDNLKQLADQRYTPAMEVLANKLMASNEPKTLELGREWAYKAAVNGRIGSLSMLAYSYLAELESLKEFAGETPGKGIEERIEKATVNMHSTFAIIRESNPALASAIDQISASQLDESYKDQIKKESARLTKDFKNQRANLGLADLNRLQPEVPKIDESAIFCEERSVTIKPKR